MTMLALLPLALAAAPVAADRAADIAALTEAKLNAWPRYYREQDADGLATFLADDFVALSDDGARERKDQVVAWLRTHPWAGSENGFRYEIKDIVFYGADTANVYGVGRFDGRNEAGPCRMAYTSANIFVRQQGRWRAAFSHTSAARCAPASP